MRHCKIDKSGTSVKLVLYDKAKVTLKLKIVTALRNCEKKFKKVGRSQQIVFFHQNEAKFEVCRIRLGPTT
jgi:hypothetical protein